MSAHESDKYMTDRKFYHYLKTIFVTTYIENVVLIPNIVSSRKVCLDIRQILPFCFFCYGIPTFECSLRVSMSFRTIELNQSSM